MLTGEPCRCPVVQGARKRKLRRLFARSRPEGSAGCDGLTRAFGRWTRLKSAASRCSGGCAGARKIGNRAGFAMASASRGWRRAAVRGSMSVDVPCSLGAAVARSRGDSRTRVSAACKLTDGAEVRVPGFRLVARARGRPALRPFGAPGEARQRLCRCPEDRELARTAVPVAVYSCNTALT